MIKVMSKGISPIFCLLVFFYVKAPVCYIFFTYATNIHRTKKGRIQLINLLKYKDLYVQLILQEISKRYRGTYLGIIWSFLTPLAMLLTYTFVFSFILQTPQNVPVRTNPGLPYFALSIFSGLIPFYIFSEIILLSPTCILSVPNYVKKVVFPLEILPVVLLGSSVVHSIISCVILVVAAAIGLGTVSYTLFLLPLAYIPLLLLCLGMGWLLSSLGVYIRDVGKITEVGAQIVFFLCPIVYSVQMIPERFHWIFDLNPLAVVIGDFRRVLLWNQPIAWIPWFRWTLVLALFAWFGYIWFMKTKKGFANVV